MNFLVNTSIDFLGKRKIAVTFSAAFLLFSLIALLVLQPNLGIDFTGGTQVQVLFKKDGITVEQIRGALDSEQFAEIQRLADNQNEFLIRLQSAENSEATWENIAQGFVASFGKDSFERRSIEKVGPKIGGEMRNKAITAIIWALALIMVYIAFRFEWRFAVGAVFALAHDVLFTLGIFTMLGLEINLSVIAAFLTIVGYSLNDTIVVFDRVRENLGDSTRRAAYIEKFNQSLNDVLGRTVVTSVTTFMVVVTLFIAGSDVIRVFALAMMIGVLVGTYSSLFIASPTVVYLHDRFPKNN